MSKSFLARMTAEQCRATSLRMAAAAIECRAQGNEERALEFDEADLFYMEWAAKKAPRAAAPKKSAPAKAAIIQMLASGAMRLDAVHAGLIERGHQISRAWVHQLLTAMPEIAGKHHYGYWLRDGADKRK